MNVKKNYVVFVTVLQALLSSTAHGQDEVLLNRYELQFRHLDSLLASPVGNVRPDAGRRGDYATGWDALSAAYASTEAALSEQERAEVALARSATGLHLTGEAYHRFNHGGTVRDEDGTPSGYHTKYQAGITWDVLQSGLFRPRSKAREAALQRRMASVASRAQLLQELVRTMREGTELKYAALQRSVWQQHLANLMLLEETSCALASQGRTTTEGMYGILEEKAGIERSLSLLPAAAVGQADWSEVGRGMVLVVDTVALLDCFRRTHTALAALAYRDSLLTLQTKQTDYWAEMGVSPYVRYAIYDRSLGARTTNLDAGISVRLPLSAESGRKRRVLKAERQTLALERQQAARSGEQELRSILNELDVLNHAVVAEYARLNTFRSLLGERRKAYKEMSGEYSRPARLKEYNACLSVVESLLFFRKRRELLLVDLQGFLPENAVTDFVHEAVIETMNQNLIQ